MDIFNSEWLIHMLEKSSKTPQGRMLSLFDVLHDWSAAPNVRLELEESTLPQALIAFCMQQAIACGAANPDILAEHIVLIARNAAKQETSHPNSGSFIHAKKAAQALIQAQTQRSKLAKPVIYGIAASLFVLIGTGALLLAPHQQTILNVAKLTAPSTPAPNFSTAHTASQNDHFMTAAYTEKQIPDGITADEAAKMYAKYEQMRNGTCQFPEALQIPDKDKTVYIENVVNGNLPTNLNDLAIANAYLEKVRCNFTPMLMANSK